MSTLIEDESTAEMTQSTQSTSRDARWQWFDEERIGLVDLLLEKLDANQLKLINSRDNGHEAAKNKARIWSTIYESFLTTKQKSRPNNSVCSREQLKVKDYSTNRTRRPPPAIFDFTRTLYDRMAQVMPIELRPYNNPTDSDGISGHFEMNETLDPETNEPYVDAIDTQVDTQVDDLVEVIDEHNSSSTIRTSRTSSSGSSNQSMARTEHECYLKSYTLQQKIFETELELHKEQLEHVREKRAADREIAELKRQKLEVELAQLKRNVVDSDE